MTKGRVSSRGRKGWRDVWVSTDRFVSRYTVIPQLTKIIRSGITFVSRNLRFSIENRLIRSGCCPLFKDKFYKIVKSTL